MLSLAALTPAQAVAADAALRRLKPTPDQLADFQKHLARLLRHLDPTKIERHGETHILDFLRDTTPGLTDGAPTERYGNVNGRRDLALHLGDTADSPVAVSIEVKGPKNPQEMLAPGDLNRKAFQQLLLYYLEDRSDDRADDFRRLVVTTGFEWYIFDAQDFNTLFWKDAALRRDFKAWKQGAKASPDTDFFYKSIAGKYLAAATGTLRAAYVDLRGGPPTTPAELANLWRLFGPAYLLKEYPSTRPDANTLNQEFYSELLYLMGLQEQTVGGVRRIGRCAEAERQPGALLENILYQMDIGHDLGRLPPDTLLDYGPTPAAQREEVALALCLMWVNRLLFLKLLEGQLVRYHPAAHAGAFRFLTPERLPDYDELHGLFFGVLNRPPGQRPAPVRTAFRELPYLNSSLFQPAALEEQVLYIRELNDRAGLRPFPHSVLKKKGAAAPAPAPDAKGHWLALPYLLAFLDAFDFGSEAGEGVGNSRALPGALPGDPTPPAPLPDGEGGATAAHPSESAGSPSPSGRGPGGGVNDGARPLLSAAVLGLVFEKINGYRDGSFYTPGFVTMYMARHTLRRAVVRRFTQGEAATLFPELRGCTSWQELRDSFLRPRRAEYGAWFNGLTVLDPAVGSGHFLVSALNELLALKADLRLLTDADGNFLNYTLRVEHDELVVIDNDTDAPARYQVATYDAATGQRTVARKHTTLQATLFREKRALMEHALFGVDLNPNSVRICRLRLWIELLKHAYYRPESDFRDLETLPNLDLNVRVGNSLISRNRLADNLSTVFRNSGITVERYRSLVHEFFSASGQQKRQELDAAIGQLKANVGTAIRRGHPLARRVQETETRLLLLKNNVPDLFGKKLDADSQAVELRRLTLELEQRQQELLDEQQGTFYQQAFEWRFEFPEVLDDDARFRGFDVVLGNPPYIRQEAFAASKPFFKQRYATFDGKADLYVYFVELGLGLLAPGGELSFIAPNKWLRAGYGAPLRRWLQSTHELVEFVDFGDLPVFAEATTYPAILSVQQHKPTATSSFRATAIPKLPPPTLDALVNTHARAVTQAALSAEGWNLANDDSQALLDKLKAAGMPLGEYLSKNADGQIYNGVKTAFNQAFIIDATTRDALIADDVNSSQFIKPFVAGRDIKRYQKPASASYLLYIDWNFNLSRFPAIEAHLMRYEVELKARAEVKAGRYPWYALERPRLEKQGFVERAKIIFPDIASRNHFTLDTNGFYIDNTVFSVPNGSKFLLGVLNSVLALFFIKSIGSSIRGGFLRWKTPHMAQLPIPHATTEQQAEIAALVERILAARAAEATADTTATEAAIDAKVAALYGLTPAEAAHLSRPAATA